LGNIEMPGHTSGKKMLNKNIGSVPPDTRIFLILTESLFFITFQQIVPGAGEPAGGLLWQ